MNLYEAKRILKENGYALRRAAGKVLNDVGRLMKSVYGVDSRYDEHAGRLEFYDAPVVLTLEAVDGEDGSVGLRLYDADDPTRTLNRIDVTPGAADYDDEVYDFAGRLADEWDYVSGVYDADPLDDGPDDDPRRMYDDP